MGLKAVAILRGDSNVKGTVTISQESADKPAIIKWNITGNDPNSKRGFHIHAYGDNTSGCASAGPHFNPAGVDHGAPEDAVRHVGDLGNIDSDAQGNSVGSREDKLITLYGKDSVIGRSVVVHADVDDLGRGGHPDSKKTGNAGGRNACGVIGLTETEHKL